MIAVPRSRSLKFENLKRDNTWAFFREIFRLSMIFSCKLQGIYYAENQITKALPKMIKKATDPQLTQAFQTHLTETESQISRLEQVFKTLGRSAKPVDCPAIDGIVKEANEVAGEIADKQVLDAALAASAQAVEHYEMTRYGTLIAWTRQLGRDDCISLLQQNLKEEEAADKKLTAIAEQRVNENSLNNLEHSGCIPEAEIYRLKGGGKCLP
jgi:ferritin-like metal-binding protein YciE